MRFSRKTLANLVRVMEIGHTELNTLFFEYGLEDVRPVGNQRDKALALIQAVQFKTSARADEILQEIIERVLAGKSEYALRQDPAAQRLLAALNLDGLDFREQRLIPTTPAPAAVGPELSAMETDLMTQGFTTAAEHYRQASDNFTDGNWEACNGQLRSFLEDLFLVVCERLASKPFLEPSGALQHLRETGYLETDEWNILRSFWSGIQSNGPHRGLSNAQEALFRLHIATAVGRFVLSKLQAS